MKEHQLPYDFSDIPIAGSILDELQRLQRDIKLWERRVQNPQITGDPERNEEEHKENQRAVAWYKLEIERKERELYE